MNERSYDSFSQKCITLFMVLILIGQVSFEDRQNKIKKSDSVVPFKA